MSLTLEIYQRHEMDDRDRALCEREHGPLEDFSFAVFFRKHVDYEGTDGHGWSGWPLDGLGLRMVKVDDPDNWKVTWFLFFHA